MNKPLIAVVDDNADIVGLIVEVLHDEGYQTVSALDADGVEPLLTHEYPDLLLIDIHMPGTKTGIALLQDIRANPATMAIPILVSTADAAFLREHAGALRALGCETIAKPFDIDALMGCIASLLPPRRGA